MSAMMPWMRQTEDELISAYIDGQLDDPSRQSFEARINADPALHKRVEATRTLVKTARQTPVVVAPRNFTLPRSMTKAPASPQTERPGRMLWRIGSALAAAVFVITLGLDAIGGTQPAAAPRAASTFADVAPAATISGANASSNATPAGNVSDQMASTNAPAATVAPAAPSFKAAPLTSAPTETPEAAPTPGLKVRAAARMVITSTAMQEQATPTPEMADAAITTSQVNNAAGASLLAPSPAAAPAHAPPAESAVPPVDPLRMIAGLALIVAIITGIIGWVLR